MIFKYLTSNNLSLEQIWAWARQLIDDLNRLASVEVPSGTVAMWAGGDPPLGWLACDGSSYLVNDRRKLFAAIGYTYGGSAANFSVPNTSPISGFSVIIKA